LDDDQNVTVNPNITSQSVVTVTSHNGGPTQHEVIQYLLTLNLQGLPEGQHKIIVYVLIGLSSPLPCPPSYVAFEPLYFTVSAPPTILVTSPQNITYATQNIPVNFLTNEHVTQTTYSLDGQENVTVIGNTTLSGLPIGPHNITCYATDGLGNWAAPQTVYFEVANSQSSVAKSFHLEPTYFLIAAAGLAAVAAGACLFYFKARKRPCK
jgi:hypothetical protein